jgi:hypothetical protein
MTKIRFNTDNITISEIVEFFEQFMFISKPTLTGTVGVALGALTFYPDGTMETGVPLKNQVLQVILKELREAGHEYEIQ